MCLGDIDNLTSTQPNIKKNPFFVDNLNDKKFIVALSLLTFIN
jgi:hypothetical protein